MGKTNNEWLAFYFDECHGDTQGEEILALVAAAKAEGIREGMEQAAGLARAAAAGEPSSAEVTGDVALLAIALCIDAAAKDVP